jgi:hypothetical protein
VVVWYRTREEHSDHYTTDVVIWYELKLNKYTCRYHGDII